MSRDRLYLLIFGVQINNITVTFDTVSSTASIATQLYDDIQCDNTNVDYQLRKSAEEILSCPAASTFAQLRLAVADAYKWKTFGTSLSRQDKYRLRREDAERASFYGLKCRRAYYSATAYGRRVYSIIECVRNGSPGHTEKVTAFLKYLPQRYFQGNHTARASFEDTAQTIIATLTGRDVPFRLYEIEDIATHCA